MNDVCRSPYCECPVGKCREGKVDARGEPVSDSQRLSEARAQNLALQDRLAVVEANLRLREQELRQQADSREQLRKLKDSHITVCAENSTMRQSISAMAAELERMRRQRRNQRRELRNLQKAYREVLKLIEVRLGGPGFAGHLKGRLDVPPPVPYLQPQRVEGAMPGWIVPASMAGGASIVAADAETGAPVDIAPPPDDVVVRLLIDGVAYKKAPETGGENGACTGCSFVLDADQCLRARKLHSCESDPGTIFVRPTT